MWYCFKHFHPYLRDLLVKFWEINKKCSNSVKFWARKMLFSFKWVRISPEIDWRHYEGASPAPTCIVRHQTMTKTPSRWSVAPEPSVGGTFPPIGVAKYWGVSNKQEICVVHFFSEASPYIWWKLWPTICWLYFGASNISPAHITVRI